METVVNVCLVNLRPILPYSDRYNVLKCVRLTEFTGFDWIYLIVSGKFNRTGETV